MAVRNFEVQVYRGGKWTIDSVYDERELALYEAQRMSRTGRFLGVRVLEETILHASGENRTRIIYRGDVSPSHRPVVRRPARRPVKRKSDELVILRRYQAYVEKMDDHRYRILMICMLIVIFGMSVLLGLQMARI